MPHAESPLDFLLPALADLAHWLSGSTHAGVIIGGLAAGLQGRPRITKDIDAAVLATVEDAPEVLADLVRCGFEPRVEDPLEFARDTGVLLLSHVGSGIEVDLTFATLPFEVEMVERGRSLEISGLQIKVASPEDLLVMKALARRPVDIADIEGLLDANPELDLAHVRLYLRTFADLLEAPSILADFEGILERKGLG